jgi:hypothetical protein
MQLENGLSRRLKEVSVLLARHFSLRFASNSNAALS